ncbi:hypothetical protein DFH08DRAFT_811059 [Mycena albidolilacea]|uniref:Uncharacterized protein n=1 Tax=Mycena albidolilacea TaxID=1033008 RepID=A0AAD6ZVZ6_9AGAR|nr:hypothetical protein DFH08DRAFT_811059 [Mycena albidolilacea]
MPGHSTSTFPIERLITKGTGEWPVAAHEVEGTGVAMVRTHATMKLVIRYGARMRGSIWAGLTKSVNCAMGRACELVRGTEGGGDTINEQGSRTHIRNETRLTRGTQEPAQEWVDRESRDRELDGVIGRPEWIRAASVLRMRCYLMSYIMRGGRDEAR